MDVGFVRKTTHHIAFFRVNRDDNYILIYQYRDLPLIDQVGLIRLEWKVFIFDFNTIGLANCLRANSIPDIIQKTKSELDTKHLIIG